MLLDILQLQNIWKFYDDENLLVYVSSLDELDKLLIKNIFDDVKKSNLLSDDECFDENLLISLPNNLIPSYIKNSDLYRNHMEENEMRDENMIIPIKFIPIFGDDMLSGNTHNNNTIFSNDLLIIKAKFINVLDY